MKTRERSYTFIGLAFTSQAFFLFLVVLSPRRSTISNEKRKTKMGEAFIWYRGRSGIDPELLKPTTVTSNGEYEAPITGTYRVSCVGGGGGGGGGCRNAWNTSQVFYGSAGTRGSLSTVNVNLNQGDKVTITIGAGGAAGTNNTSPQVYSNGQTNSRGTNGGTGGTTTFGSYVSGAGGARGLWSWSARIWTNTQNWSNTYQWTNTKQWNNNVSYIRALNVTKWQTTNSLYYTESSWTAWYPQHIVLTYSYNYYGSYWSNLIYNELANRTIGQSEASSLESQWLWSAYNTCYEMRTVGPLGNVQMQYYLWHNINWFNWSNVYGLKNVFTGWWNRYTNYSTRCYTTSQTGSWWYTSDNNVTTSGTRAYSGDGGNSGRAGNAGFILIIPPQSA